MRTKFLFISTVCCFALQANAQTFNNTIVNDNSSWSILSYGIFYEMPVWTQYIYFEGDSIIEEIAYKKVFSCEDEPHENIKYEGLMREENKKTYFIPANSETEYLLYDFSLEEGMTFEYIDPWGQEPDHNDFPFYIKKVDSIEINGVQKKRIQLGPLPLNDNFIRAIWIENIGSLTGLFYPCNLLVPASRLVKLLCFFQNDELIYKNPEYSKCYYDNPEEIAYIQNSEIESYYIYPNPVDNILTISNLNIEISQIEIFNINGKKIYSQTNEKVIDVSSFSKGTYFLNIHTKNGKNTFVKFIKK